MVQTEKAWDWLRFIEQSGACVGSASHLSQYPDLLAAWRNGHRADYMLWHIAKDTKPCDGVRLMILLVLARMLRPVLWVRLSPERYGALDPTLRRWIAGQESHIMLCSPAIACGAKEVRAVRDQAYLSKGAELHALTALWHTLKVLTVDAGQQQHALMAVCEGARAATYGEPQSVYDDTLKAWVRIVLDEFPTPDITNVDSHR